jgi:hypothetical protein
VILTVVEIEMIRKIETSIRPYWAEDHLNIDQDETKYKIITPFQIEIRIENWIVMNARQKEIPEYLSDPDDSKCIVQQI